MCQCFLARKTPSSMNIPDSAEQDTDGSKISTSGGGGGTSKANPAFEAARTQGVIIKTPTEGPNQQMSENDLVVESLVLRELHHPNIVGILGGGKTPMGSRYIHTPKGWVPRFRKRRWRFVGVHALLEEEAGCFNGAPEREQPIFAWSWQ